MNDFGINNFNYGDVNHYSPDSPKKQSPLKGLNFKALREENFIESPRKETTKRTLAGSITPENSPKKVKMMGTKILFRETESDLNESNTLKLSRTPNFQSPSLKNLPKTPAIIASETDKKIATLTYSGSNVYNNLGELLISTGEKLSLRLIGEGTIHKVWKVENKGSLVIKVWLGVINANKKLSSYKETTQAYDELMKRSDIQIATWYNKGNVWKDDGKGDGLYVYEYIDGEEPSFEDVKILIQDMIKDPSKFIADFRAVNLKKKDEKIVIIDPSIASDKKKEYPLLLMHLIENWMLNADKTLNKTGVLSVITEFDQLELSEQARKDWNEAVIKLKELIQTHK